MSETASKPSAPSMPPGDILNWPMLKIVYRTEPKKLAALLPPGIERGRDSRVHVTVYNFPVHNEPEYGVVVAVDADYGGQPGLYSLAYGIDQESAIFVSQEMNGQPKFLCDISYFRMLERVSASCSHAGYTFLEYEGKATEVVANTPDHIEDEWWIKVSRGVGMGHQKPTYDFPPHVVRVHSSYGTAYKQKVEGTLTLRESPWDPIAKLLPVAEAPSVHLWWPTFKGREIAFAGKLDPEAFWPHADTIGGSRWPGENGGPRKSA